MKTNKYIEKLRAKGAAELREALVSAREELSNLRFQNVTSQLDDTMKISEVRRSVARIQTIITERAGA